MKLIKIFNDVFKKNWIIFILLILSIIGIVVLQLLPPQILKTIVDDYLEKKIYDGIATLAVFYLIAVLFSYLCEFFKTLFTTYIGQKIVLNIRYRMSAKLLRLPISYYNNNSAGDIMSRFTNDINSVNTMFSDGLINMIVDLFKILGILISIFILSTSLFIYTILIVPLIIIISNIFRKRIYKAQLLNRKTMGKMNSFIQEAYSGLRLYKIFNYEKRLSSSFKPLTEQQMKIRRKVNLMDAIFPCIMQIIKAVVICLFVLFTTKKINLITGISIGALAASIDLISKLFSPIEELAVEFQSIQQVFASFNRIKEFMNEKEEKKITNNLINQNKNIDISFNNITFSYDNNINILENVSFNINNGQKIALVGRTGSGKTTILNLLAGLYPTNEGNISIYGYDPFTLPPSIRRKLIGIVPQTIINFTGTIKEIITLKDETISDEEIICALKTVGLHDEIEKLPRKYDTVIGEGENNLSFGQMQLLTLARAIVTNPPVLLLDELTSGMDAITEAKVLQAIKDISINRTIITISHRLSGIIDADYVYVLSYGKIIEQGNPNELIKNQSWYAKYKQLEEIGWQHN